MQENRRLLAGSLGLGPFATARQVHGTAVLQVTAPDVARTDADVLFATQGGLPLAVMTADCVPVALASEREGALAAVHAGWRGLASGVVQRAMGLFGEPRDVTAVIGPAIGPCHYEVGAEVVEAVRQGVGEAIVAGSSQGRSQLDLAATVEWLLRHLGSTVVEAAGVCTACEPDRFFSHRRDALTGRQALVAVRL